MVTQRPVGPQDARFLLELYAITRAPEMALVDWDVATKDAFIAMQFAAQSAHHRTAYPDASSTIVLADGEAAGRMCVHRSAQRMLLVDISLLPAQRNRGIGTTLICTLVDEAAAANMPVRLHVARFNTDARRLYDRLGFLATGEDGLHVEMEWAPPRTGDGVGSAPRSHRRVPAMAAEG